MHMMWWKTLWILGSFVSLGLSLACFQDLPVPVAILWVLWSVMSLVVSLFPGGPGER